MEELDDKLSKLLEGYHANRSGGCDSYGRDTIEWDFEINGKPYWVTLQQGD